jgi:phosphatidylglycerophosphate synthase
MIYGSFSRTIEYCISLGDFFVRKITLASWITLSRLILIVPIYQSIIQTNWNYAFYLFLLACVTDILDGFIARKRNECTFVGAVLDAISDKLLIITCLYACLTAKIIANSVISWLIIFLIIKESLQVVGGIFLYWTAQLYKIESNVFGKSAMFIQVLFIAIILGQKFFQISIFFAEELFIFLIIFFTTLSAFSYGISCFKRLKG